MSQRYLYRKNNQSINPIVKKNIHINTIPLLIKWLPFCLLGAFIQSCDQSETNPVDSYQYYPLELGRYQIYQVQETIYSAGQKNPVVTTWQEKDEVDRISSNADPVISYIIARYRRNVPTDYWQKLKEFAVTKSPDKILTNIDNQPILSLVFPPNATIRWNGNTYNTLDDQQYRYMDINQPGSVDKLSFENTLTVVERRDTSIIDRYIGIKKYALGAGLILDEQTAYQYCQDDDCIGEGIIESGSYKTRKIIEFGLLK